jgi:hypothetical protein
LVVKLNIGGRIKLAPARFEHLSTALFAEIESKLP